MFLFLSDKSLPRPHIVQAMWPGEHMSEPFEEVHSSSITFQKQQSSTEKLSVRESIINSRTVTRINQLFLLVCYNLSWQSRVSITKLFVACEVVRKYVLPESALPLNEALFTDDSAHFQLCCVCARARVCVCVCVSEWVNQNHGGNNYLRVTQNPRNKINLRIFLNCPKPLTR
jgi:hypothetical protein